MIFKQVNKEILEFIQSIPHVLSGGYCRICEKRCTFVRVNVKIPDNQNLPDNNTFVYCTHCGNAWD